MTTGIMLGGVLWAAASHADTPEPVLTVGTVTGIPGGTVAVPIQLTGDSQNAAISADLDIAFPADLVEFNTPVSANCHVAERISSSHQVGGTVPHPGLLRFTVFDTGGLDPLGDGEIATCDFHVLAGVPTGTAALTVQFAELQGVDGDIPVTAANGAILITNTTPTFTPTVTPTPKSTATVTNTPAATATRTSTATSTKTPVVTATSTGTLANTPTNTPGVTATVTNTSVVTATATDTPVATATATGTRASTSTATATKTKGSSGGSSGGCDIVPVEQSSGAGTLALLLAPAALVWARRRRV